MEIIPVIDLMQGQVVHARRGERHLYRPIQSTLRNGSAPMDIVGALLGLYPFNNLYIADLDAIRGHGNHATVIDEIRQSFPQIRIWLDAGLSSPAQLATWENLDADIVIGSENIASLALYRQLLDAIPPTRAILSLDFTAQGFQGPSELLSSPEHWPQRILAMTLTRVGSHQGPDLGTLRTLQHNCTGKSLYAAGGIRNATDLQQAAALGVRGALIASALHNGQLSHAELDSLHTGTHPTK